MCNVYAAYDASLCDKLMFMDAVDVDAVVCVSVCVCRVCDLRAICLMIVCVVSRALRRVRCVCVCFAWVACLM